MKYVLLLLFITCLNWGCSKEKNSGEENTNPEPLKEISNPITAKTVSHVARLGDRFFIRSVLEQVFLSDSRNSASDTQIEDIIINKIFRATAYFNGACHVHDTKECSTGSRADEITQILPISNPSREGLRLNACRQIAQIDQAVLNALEHAHLNVDDVADENGIKAAVKLFYPVIEFPSPAVDSLVQLYQKAKEKSSLNGWRFVLLSICSTPEWQIP